MAGAAKLCCSATNALASLTLSRAETLAKDVSSSERLVFRLRAGKTLDAVEGGAGDEGGGIEAGRRGLKIDVHGELVS